MLTLNKGLYLVSVKSASPQRVGDDAEFALPAIHIGVGPGGPRGQVEFMTGPRNDGPWLFENKAMLVVKVNNGPASLLLTSLRTPTMASIEVEVQRLDGKTEPTPAAQAPELPALAAPRPTATAALGRPNGILPSAPPQALKDAAGRTALRTRIALHIQNRGDVSYVDNFWAGALGERLAIEAFSIHPLEGLTPGQIEYKGMTEHGVETSWISDGGECGSRGLGTALVGFAVRVKPGQALPFECEYRGSFSSGKIVGPMKNGAACRAEANDRLEAIQLFIVEQTSPESWRAPPLVSDAAPAQRPAEETKVEPRPMGPRFSVFRENVE